MILKNMVRLDLNLNYKIFFVNKYKKNAKKTDYIKIKKL